MEFSCHEIQYHNGEQQYTMIYDGNHVGIAVDHDL